MAVVLLIRHGQASMGAADYDQLSDLGQQQAALVGARLAGGRPVTRIVSGNLYRQRETAGRIAKAVGNVLVSNDGRFDEYDHVDLLGDQASAFVFEEENTQSSREAATAALDEAIVRWVHGVGQYTESHDAFTSRVQSAVDEYASMPGVTVIVSSGGVISSMCARLLGMNQDTWPRLAKVTVNSGITKMISGKSGTTLLTFNDHAHLEGDGKLITYR